MKKLLFYIMVGLIYVIVWCMIWDDVRNRKKPNDKSR